MTDPGPEPHVHHTLCVTCGEEAPPEPGWSQAFRDGEAWAFRRVLAYLDALPEEGASRTRDTGRGAAHAARQVREAVLLLQQDAGQA